MTFQRLGIWETVSEKHPRVFAAEMRDITRTINVHVCTMQETYFLLPPAAFIIFLPAAFFPSPRLGEVEREGAAASPRDAIKDPAYHASQDAAGIAAPVHAVLRAQGEPSCIIINNFTTNVCATASCGTC